MLLRASGEHKGENIDLNAINGAAEGDGGIPNSPQLIAFAEAVVGDDAAALATARQAILDQMGAEALVDSCGVVATFNAIDRVGHRLLARTALGEADRRRMYQLHDWFQVLLNLEVPVIAAVDGAAYGGGFGLALGCDFVLASDRARFCCVFQRIGLVPDVGCLFTLPRIVGLQKAKEIAYTARPILADEAKDLGIVMDVYPPEDLMDAALALAGRLAQASTPAIGATKRILNQSFNLDAHALIEMEAAAQAIFFTTDYHKDAVRRFVDKEQLAFNWEAMDKAEKAGNG